MTHCGSRSSVVRLHGAGSPAPSGSIRLQGLWRRTAPDGAGRWRRTSAGAGRRRTLGAGRRLAPEYTNPLCANIFHFWLSWLSLEPDRSRTRSRTGARRWSQTSGSSVAPVRLQLSQQVHMFHARCAQLCLSPSPAVLGQAILVFWPGHISFLAGSHQSVPLPDHISFLAGSHQLCLSPFTAVLGQAILGSGLPPGPELCPCPGDRVRCAC